MTDTSMCAAVDMSQGSPTIEDMAKENVPATIKDGVRGMEGCTTAVEHGSAAVEGVKDGFAAVVDGSEAESMAEAEGVQDVPQLAATAYAPGSFGPCPHSICALCPILYVYGLHVEIKVVIACLCPK